MSNKSKSAATNDELDKLFEGIGEEDKTPAAPPNTSAGKRPKSSGQSTKQSEQDLLAELDNLAAQRPASRPQTPRLSSTTNAPKRPSTEASTQSTSTRNSEEKTGPQNPPRKSGESTRSYHTSTTPASQAKVEPETEPESTASAAIPTAQAQQAQQGGGWWGGIFATASAAVKQAEAAVKEIQKNEEAQRWAEQVKGNVGALRGLGGELRSRALPTFTNILHTLAPPISSHERLQIHITHDFIGYPSLDPLIYQTFSRIMAQVEGGDLMVIQRGHESSPRRGSETTGFTGSSSSGWNDGPWWRQTNERRDLGSVKGLIEGTKLVKVSAEAYATEYFASRGGIEEAAKQATEVLSESNPVRSSDIFLAIQAISHTESSEFFGGRATQANKETSEAVEDPEIKPDELISFAIYLHDPIHSITYHTLTQSFPQRWINWLDTSSSTSENPISPIYESNNNNNINNPTTTTSNIPSEIAEIINTGGVDPREWVAEWVEEVLLLGIGIVAQRYVAKRMGVGEGGIGKGKAREEIVESGGGEAARAI